MSVASLYCACWMAASFWCADDKSLDGPPLRSPAASSPETRQKHYVVQIKLIEVDEQGRETIIGSPQLKTTGGNAGLSIDYSEGRQFEFTINLTDGVKTNELSRELAPAGTTTPLADVAIERKLNSKISLNATQLSRKEVLRAVAQQAGISIAIDPESAKTAKAQLETLIDMKVDDESVTQVLDRLVQPLKLGYAVKHEVVLIGDADKLLPAPNEYSVKTYVVADLVSMDEGDGTSKPDFEPIIERIKSTVHPESWDRKEGAATIRPFNSTSSLVVRQTASGHRAVERLLAKMRQEKPRVIEE